MFKIRQIGKYTFADKETADKYDYLYKKYLKLPFDFSIQMISGDDMLDVRHLYKEAYHTSKESLVETYEYTVDTDMDYQERMNKFKGIVQTFIRLIDNGLTDNTYNCTMDDINIFFYCPEAFLSVRQQQTFIHDCLMILKSESEDHFLYTDGKYPIKHVNFFIATTSIFIMSECFPGNLLILKDLSVSESKDTFGGNLYDIAVMNTDYGTSEIAQTITSEFITDCKENGCQDDAGFIGDSFIRGMVKKKQKGHSTSIF